MSCEFREFSDETNYIILKFLNLLKLPNPIFTQYKKRLRTNQSLIWVDSCVAPDTLKYSLTNIVHDPLT